MGSAQDAGHESESFPGNIGVFATCGMNTYMMYNLVNNRRDHGHGRRVAGSPHRQRHEFLGDTIILSS